MRTKEVLKDALAMRDRSYGFNEKARSARNRGEREELERKAFLTPTQERLIAWAEEYEDDPDSDGAHEALLNRGFTGVER
jgi:hypothetical protein